MQTLLILSPGFPENEQDSTCLPAVQQFVLSLKKTHPNISIVVLSFQYPFKPNSYLWHNVKVIALGGKNEGGIKRWYTWLKAYKAVNSLRKNNPSIGILSLWLNECSLLGKVFSNWFGMKHFMWLHGQDAKKNNTYIKRIGPKSNEILAISEFLQEEFYKNHNIKPFLVAENGINPQHFPELNIKKRNIDILGVGSLIPLKNYTLFIEIIAEIKTHKPDIKVCLAGSGEQESALKTHARSLGLQDNIQFVGLLPHTEIFDLMNSAKLFLHTSTYEGNSTVLIEALYSGCYVLSTQALSSRTIPNLTVCENKAELIKQAIEVVLNKSTNTKRITFNTMDETADKIMRLYLS